MACDYLKQFDQHIQPDISSEETPGKESSQEEMWLLFLNASIFHSFSAVKTNELSRLTGTGIVI
jgi:hypothetical protein